MVFNGKNNDTGFVVEVNNASINNYNAWMSGCNITPDTGLTVDISSGKLLFQGVLTDVSADSVTLDTADATLDRYDLIVYGSGGIAKITGTPATIPRNPDYTIEDYVVLAMISVPATKTTILTSDIIDYRCYGVVSSNEELQKTSDDIKSLSVTDTSGAITSSLSHTNAILLINQGTNTCYINFGASATTNQLPMLPKSKLYLPNVDLLQVAAICSSGLTTTLKVQFFGGSQNGARTSAEVLRIAATDSSQNVTLAGGSAYKKIFMLNVGSNNVYYKFASTSGTDGMPVFPNDYIEIENFNEETLAGICNAGLTADLRILNLY